MRHSVAAVLIMILLGISVPRAVANTTSTSLTLNVSADGTSAITQTLAVNPNDTSITVTLLSAVLSDVVVLDQNGAPLEFQISGSNITIYTIGATAVTLGYDTQSLTGKQGTVWTLSFTTLYNATVVLPQGSTLTSVSSSPQSIATQNGSPVVSVPPGTWELSYGVPIQQVTTSSGSSSTASVSSSTSGSGTTSVASSVSTTSVGSSSSTSVAGSTGTPQTAYEVAVVSAVILAAVAVFLLARRRRRFGATDVAGLRPDDVQVLDFIAEKGGRVLEPEIRTRFALPKTTAWRQIKRLERLGYVKVTKIGSQNQIELIKNRERAA